MRRWTLLSRAERGGVILSGAWTTSTCYKPREIERPALLLDPRMDNWGQGTFTLCVSRLYRRAITVADQVHFGAFGAFRVRWVLGLEPFF